MNNGTDAGYIAACIKASIPRAAAQARLKDALRTRDMEIIKREMALFNPVFDNCRHLQGLISENPEVALLYENHKKEYYKKKD